MLRKQSSKCRICGRAIRGVQPEYVFGEVSTFKQSGGGANDWGWDSQPVRFPLGACFVCMRQIRRKIKKAIDLVIKNARTSSRNR